MKTLSTDLSNHLDREVTTLTTCWKIVRRDGVVLRFTDHDQDITIAGDGIYEAESSYSRTAIANNSDLSVDNLDISGVLDSDRLDEDEMRNGLYNGAEVYIFVVNYADTTQGVLKMRRGWFGEVSVQDNGSFTVEIRGLAQALGMNFLEVFSAECRADFCDSRCKLNINDFKRQGTVTNAGDGLTTFIAAKLPDAPSTGTSVGAHTTWGIALGTLPLADYGAIADIRFWDQSGNLITGGVASESTVVNGRHAYWPGHTADRARDGLMSTSWGARDTYDADHNPLTVAVGTHWFVTFPTPVDVKSVEIISTSVLGEAPTAFDLLYTNSNPDPIANPGLIWGLAKSCTYTWTAPGQSAVWGLGSLTSEPINVSGSPVSIPPPFNTISSYVGGTITWLTGRNRGRTVEITAYDNTTHQIEMFDRMGYPVQIGDTFEIAQGCNKSLSACKLYNNVINRRAEDFVPGIDELVQYPNAKS